MSKNQHMPSLLKEHFGLKYKNRLAPLLIECGPQVSKSRSSQSYKSFARKPLCSGQIKIKKKALYTDD
jgi:hypothetical protein